MVLEMLNLYRKFPEKLQQCCGSSVDCVHGREEFFSLKLKKEEMRQMEKEQQHNNNSSNSLVFARWLQLNIVPLRTNFLSFSKIEKLAKKEKAREE